MRRGTLALFLLLVAVDPSSAQPATPSSLRATGPARCPTLVEAPAEIQKDPPGFDRIIRYLTLVERYCRNADEALNEVDEFPWTDFKDSRGYLALHRDRLVKSSTSPTSVFGSVDWYVRVVQTASMLHLDRALQGQPGSETHASHLNWSRELVRLLEGVEGESTFRHDWYVAIGALLHGEVAFRDLDAHLREARGAFPESARVALAWGMMREAQASRRILPLLLAHNMARVFVTERPDPERWLEDAERSYSRALNLDPDLHEARLRHGQVLVALGRPDAGYADLLAVRDATSEDRRFGYLASLFAGAVLERNDRVPEAVESYRAAAELYPECQIASFALSHALRKAGNRDEAARLVQMALERGTNKSCLDPVWIYDLGPGPQADELIDGLRRRVRR